MKVLLLTSKLIKKSKSIESIQKICDLTILDFEKDTLFKTINADLAIVLTKKILSRKNSFYKKINSLLSKKKIKIIEIAFLKSDVSKEKANSDAIIHGFEEMTWKIIKKIIKS